LNDPISRSTYDTNSSSDSDSCLSEHDLDDTSESNEENDTEAEIPTRDRPRHVRTCRTIPNTILWDVIKL